MSSRTKALSTLLLFSCSVLYAGLCSAADDAPFGVTRAKDAPVIQAGPVEVHPYLSLLEIYSDNIYLVPVNRKHDFITTIAPGVQFKMPIRRHALFLTGNTTINQYAHHSSENSIDWNVSGAGDFNFGSRINLKLSDKYLDAHEPRSQSSSSAMEKYRNNNASASLSYILADISKLQLDYTSDIWKYTSTSSDFRSRDENAVSAYVYYRVMPKTSLFTEYDFKNVYFTSKTAASGDLDNTVHSGLLGVTWELSERSKGTVKGGYLYKIFDDRTQKNFGTFAASVDIAHNFNDYNSVKLDGARTVNESSLAGSSYSVSTGVTGEATHKFNDRISATLKASFSDESFANSPRSDQIILGGAKVAYAFRRWLECSVEYYWRQKNSNFNEYDSIENNAAVAFKAFF
jgi:hypothetical protein